MPNPTVRDDADARPVSILTRGVTIGGAALIVALLAAFGWTIVLATDLSDRLAAATGAATTALAAVAVVTIWQNLRLVAAAREEARAAHELVAAANNQAESSSAQAG